MNLLDRVVKGFTEREIRKLFKEVSKIEAFEPAMQKLSDKELSAKTEEFKARLAKGETLDQLLPEAFAVVREAAVRVIGQRPFPVQLLGGIVLHQGRIAEMKTGEGKTLTATAPAYLNALTGNGVHVITVNDYLARFQKDWMSKVYNFLGLSVGCILHGMSSEQRRAAYNCDITYGTNNEFGFDYLRDNMVVFADQQVQRQLNYAIVDEVDSILIDEARTPLIISGEGEKSTDLYRVADIFAQGLKAEVDFVVDEKQKSVVLTDESGTVKAERFFQIENLSDPENMEISHHINQSLKAHYMMKRDVDYVVKEGEIMIVDEHTGRLMEGRRYSNGLHQAIEAKEQLEVRRESQTLATITLQNYFRMFNKLSGMTGTAKTEEDELQHIYNLDVVAIPTNKPIQRTDMADIIYRTMDGKFKAVIVDIIERHKLGQPILVGTVSIETSEYLSGLLKKKGIQHEVLNAKQHEREAEIVAQAGRKNAVTIATNMAGRGTDILLGGNPEFMSKKEMLKLEYSEQMINYVLSPLHYEDEEIIAAKETYQQIYAKFKAITDAEAKEVCAVGGLHIIGTERHESRRIDNQLRGRAGRQGDPGSSQFFLSFDDDLMRLFVNDNVKAMVDRLGMDDETPLEASLLSKSIENAQKKVEGRNFAVRKHVLQYDDVMNKQRSIIYAERAKVLHGEDLKDHMLGMVDNVIDASVTLYTANSDFPEEWDLKEMEEHFHQIFMPRGWLETTIKSVDDRLQLGEKIKALAYELYEQKEAEFESERMRDLERFILLRVVDQKWMDHIDDMDQLKQGINLRAYAQEDPVRAYQKEGFAMFEDMIYNIQEEALKYIYHAAIQIDTTRTQVAKVTSESGGGDYSGPVEPVRNDEEKVGRNDPCPCGSGKKYKKCCGANL